MVNGGPPGAPTFISYLRVSTDQQGRSGLGLEAQRAAVAAYVAGAHGTVIAEYEEVESGSRDDRPQLALALAACRARHGVLVIAKLDRLARNAAFLLAIVDGAGAGGIVFCDLPEVPAGAVGKFFITLMAAVAELERGLISQRTKAALAAAKARGVKLGGPNMGRGFNTAMSRAGHQAQAARAARHAADVLPYIAAARQAGAVTGAQIAAALTARGVRPPTGGESWHPNQVRRIERATRVH
jgi:DNA invertase Pin-like site-specific DNA recombinase